MPCHTQLQRTLLPRTTTAADDRSVGAKSALASMCLDTRKILYLDSTHDLVVLCFDCIASNLRSVVDSQVFEFGAGIEHPEEHAFGDHNDSEDC